MSERKLPSFPFYARDWLSDQRVATLPLEAKGAYVDLLASQWDEGSIPSELDALARLLRVPKAKAAKLWALLQGFFVPHPILDGRLVNARLERERSSVVEYREQQRAKSQVANAKRWSPASQVVPGRSPERPRGDASGTPPGIPAGTSRGSPGDGLGTPPGIVRGPSRGSPKASPEHPSASASANQSTYPSGSGSGSGTEYQAVQTGEAVQTQSPEPELTGTKAQPDAPAAARSPRAPEPIDADLARISEALTVGGYRRGKPSFQVMARAKTLRAQGMTGDDADRLVELSYARSSSDPGALLAHWLDKVSWREVLDEDASRRRAGEAATRAVTNPSDDLAEGVYGAAPRPIRELKESLA